MNIWQDIKQLLDDHPHLKFWWRDDDLIEPTIQGDRMLKLATEYTIPLTLAVIPEPAQENLVPWLATYESLTYQIVQHGLSHTNHAGNGWKRCELVSTTNPQDLLNAKTKLETLFPNRFASMIVPPWNRFAPELEEFLSKNYKKISTFGPEQNGNFSNTHLDLICWKEGKRALTPEKLFEQIKQNLDDKVEGPLGILTHHLVHDEDHWQTLTKALETIGSKRFTNPLS